MCLYVFYLFTVGIGHDAEVDICNIPEPLACGIFKRVSLNGQPKYVALDLETTDLSE